MISFAEIHDNEYIRLYFVDDDGLPDWWYLCYGHEQDDKIWDYVKIDGKVYSGEKLRELAFRLISERESKYLDILEG
jgi:hypothetical protein